MNRKGILLFIFTILLFLNPLAAKTKKAGKNEEEEDMSLFEIDRLIRRTEYEQALKQLNIYLENNPDNFDNAQSRISKIMRARREYKDNFEELVQTFNKINQNVEAEDEELAENLTDELEDTDEDEYYAKCNKIKDNLKSIEHSPPEEIQQVLNQIDATITLNYVRPRAEKILRRSAALAKQGNYLQAVEQVKDGFEFFKVDYYIQWEDYADVISETDSLVSELNIDIQKIQTTDLLKRLSDAAAAFNQSVSNDLYDKAASDLEEVEKCFTEYKALREKIYSDSQNFQSLFEKEKDLNPEYCSTDASFLPFMVRFINGSSDIAYSGVAGALSCLPDTLITSMNNAVFAALNKHYGSYAKIFSENMSVSQELAQSTGELTEAINNYAGLENQVISAFDLVKTGYSEDTQENPVKGYTVLTDYLPELVAVSNNIYAVNGQINSMWDFQKSSFEKISSDSTSEEKSQLVNSLFDSVAQMGNLVGIKSEQELAAFDWTKAYEEEEHTEWDVLGQLYTTILDKVFQDSSTMLNQSWEKISSYYTDQTDALVKKDSEYNVLVKKYCDGFYEKIPDETHKQLLSDSEKAAALASTFETDESLNMGIYYCYPDISRGLSAYTQQLLEQDISKINDYDTLINSAYEAHPQWSEDSGISGLVMETRSYFAGQIKRLQELNSAAIAMDKEAENKIQNYEEQWANGDERYEYAEWALQQENFELARSSLTEAGNYYSEALTYQDDESKNQESYEKLQTLREQIIKGENLLVVREVRQSINTAWSDFYAGKYDEASEELAIASDRWKTTNSVENEEIRKLQSYVNNARSTQSGIEIIPSDPLYSELSQRLSTASQYYESGSRKYAEGNKAEGNEDFAAAEQKINEVKQVYPLNLNAQILTLKIEKVQNPVEFDANFKDKIDEAYNQCKSKDDSVRRNGYAYLKAYNEIDPNYKGLKDKIYQVEINLGIRQAPVDNSARNKAQTLYVQAQKTYRAAGTNQTQLKRALSLIDQAIDLNDSTEAQNLKDQILTSIGGTAVINSELSPGDRITFNQAQLDIDNNNIRRAKNTLAKMLQQHPDYKDNEEFMSLYNEANSL